MNRRHLILGALAAPLLVRTARAATPPMEVYKSPSCGCCSAWIAHVREAGIPATARDIPQETLWALKDRLGVGAELASCHTALLDGFVIEGHVPAADILRLLETRPEALGLAVPGMPIGSPGMEMGARREPFETLLMRHDGGSEIFARHR